MEEERGIWKYLDREKHRKYRWQLYLAFFFLIIGIVLLVVDFGEAGEPFSPESIGKFSLGAATSIVIHEGGHMLFLEVKNREYRFHLEGLHPVFYYKGKVSDSIQMSGLFANAFSSEAILQMEKRGPFFNGIIVGNIFEQLLYPTVRWGQGDFKYMNDMERALWGSFFVLHAGLTAVRLYQSEKCNIKSWFSVSKKGTPMLGLNIRW